MAGRADPLSIVQGETCVEYSHLVALRQRFNEVIWHPMADCSVEEGREYGRLPWKEEIDTLPDFESFFHAEVAITEGGPDGLDLIAGATQIKWVVTGGTLLARILDTATWSYFTSPTDSWYAQTRDDCKGCGKLWPLGPFLDAETSIECPKGNVQSLYTGEQSTINWAAAPSICHIVWDWSDNIGALFIEILGGLEPEILCPLDDPEYNQCCKVEGYLCKETCSLNWVAYYEYNRDDGVNQVLRLKYVDLGTIAPSETGQITGNLTPHITADKLNDVKSRVVADMANWVYNSCYVCDRCGPIINTNCSSDANPEQRTYSCPVHMEWEAVRQAFAIVNTDTCQPCGENFSGTICGCPWNELHSVMDRIEEWGCLNICSETCYCDCLILTLESSINILPLSFHTVLIDCASIAEHEGDPDCDFSSCHPCIEPPCYFSCTVPCYTDPPFTLDVSATATIAGGTIGDPGVLTLNINGTTFTWTGTPPGSISGTVTIPYTAGLVVPVSANYTESGTGYQINRSTPVIFPDVC